MILTYASWALAIVCLIVELHPKIPTHNCITKFGLLILTLSAILLAGGVWSVVIGIVVGSALTLAGFSYRYVLGAKFDKRRVQL